MRKQTDYLASRNRRSNGDNGSSKHFIELENGVPSPPPGERALLLPGPTDPACRLKLQRGHGLRNVAGLELQNNGLFVDFSRLLQDLLPRQRTRVQDIQLSASPTDLLSMVPRLCGRRLIRLCPCSLG